MSKKVQTLHLYTEVMPRSGVRAPPGASRLVVVAEYITLTLTIAQLVERSIVVGLSNARMVPGSIPGGEIKF